MTVRRGIIAAAALAIAITGCSSAPQLSAKQLASKFGCPGGVSVSDPNYLVKQDATCEVGGKVLELEVWTFSSKANETKWIGKVTDFNNTWGYLGAGFMDEGNLQVAFFQGCEGCSQGWALKRRMLKLIPGRMIDA